MEGAHDPKFTFNRMCRRQQLGDRRWLGAHDIAKRGRDNLEGGIGLATTKLFHANGARETVDGFAQEHLKRASVEFLALGNRHGSGEILHRVLDSWYRKFETSVVLA